MSNQPYSTTIGFGDSNEQQRSTRHWWYSKGFSLAEIPFRCAQPIHTDSAAEIFKEVEDIRQMTDGDIANLRRSLEGHLPMEQHAANHIAEQIVQLQAASAGRIQELTDLTISTSEGPVTADEIHPRLVDTSFLGQWRRVGWRYCPRFAAFTGEKSVNSISISLSGRPLSRMRKANSSPSALQAEELQQQTLLMPSLTDLIRLLVIYICTGATLGAIFAAAALNGYFKQSASALVGATILASVASIISTLSGWKGGWTTVFSVFAGIFGALCGISIVDAHSFGEAQYTGSCSGAAIVGLILVLGIETLRESCAKDKGYSTIKAKEAGGTIGILLGALAIAALIGWGISIPCWFATTWLEKYASLLVKIFFAHANSVAAKVLLSTTYGAMVGLVVSVARLFIQLLSKEEHVLELETRCSCIVPSNLRPVFSTLQEQFDEVVLITESDQWLLRGSDYQPSLPHDEFLAIARKGKNWWLVIPPPSQKPKVRTFSDLE